MPIEKDLSKISAKSDDEKLTEFNHRIVITVEKYHIVIVYYSVDDLPDILAFEGTRIAALIKRGMSLPSVEERTWDKKRKITVSHR